MDFKEYDQFTKSVGKMVRTDGGKFNREINRYDYNEINAKK